MSFDNLTHPFREYGIPLAEPRTLGLCAQRLARIKPAMQSFIDHSQVPGILTLIARHGKVAHLEAQGYADVERKIPLTPDSIFRLHSQSKPIAAVAVMIAYEQGYFLLDDPIADYLPEFKAMRVYMDEGLIDATGPITIRQLLTHTSGIGHYFYTDDPVADLFRQAGLDQVDARAAGLGLADYVAKLAALPLCAQPGTRWRYSLAMEVLGRLVEEVSGQNYRDFVRTEIFEHLGMEDTDFFVPEEKWHRFATLYVALPNGGYAAAEPHTSGNFDYSRQPSFYSASGGLVSTAADYLRFAQMLLNGGEFGGARILSPTSVKLIMSNHLGSEFGAQPLASMRVQWLNRKGLGHGFCGMVVTDAVASGTAGSDGEYSWGGAAGSDFWIDPKQDLIGMVFTQLMPSGICPTRARMHQMTYQAVFSWPRGE